MAVKDAVKEPAAAVVENAVVFISTGTQTELGVAHGETSPVSPSSASFPELQRQTKDPPPPADFANLGIPCCLLPRCLPHGLISQPPQTAEQMPPR